MSPGPYTLHYDTPVEEPMSFPQSFMNPIISAEAAGEAILSPGFSWSLPEAPKPGSKTKEAIDVDTRFEGVALHEQVDGMTWGYRLVEGKAAVVSCANASAAVEVPSFLGGCPVAFIAPRTFANQRGILSITLPDTVEEVCDFAFMFSGIQSFEAPESLRSIGARAFYNCSNLIDVRLNAKLERIGREAFSLTEIMQLDLPASITDIGPNAFSQSNLLFGSGAASLRIEEGSAYFLDGKGGLYKHTDEGLAFCSLLDMAAVEYTVLDGTWQIAPRAFADCSALCRVELPEGLALIQDSAFAGCGNLAGVELPDSLTAIGTGAFKNCSIKRIVLPRQLAHIGHDAFATMHRGVYVTPYIKELEVHPDNTVLYMVDGMLCRHDTPEVGDVLLLYCGRGGEVRIPDEVRMIGPAAFAGQTKVSKLVVHDHIDCIFIHGFFFESGITEIVFINAAPDGSDVVVRVPASAGGTSAVRNSFRRGVVDAELAIHNADGAIFGAANRDERYVLMCERLAHPLWLPEEARAQFTRALSQALPRVCTSFAQQNYLKGFETLWDEGILNDETFDAAMAAVAATGEAFAVSHMIELRHRRMKASAFDFDL